MYKEYSLFDLLLIKEENENRPILLFQTDSVQFVFRALTPIEYIKIKTLSSDTETINDTICQVCLIEPNDYDFSMSPFAGVNDLAAKEIIKFSMLDKFYKPLEYLEKQRSEIERNFLTRCILFIKANFPEYSYDEIKEWDYYKIIEYASMSEFISDMKGIDKKIEYDIEELKKSNDKVVNPTDKELIEYGVDPMLYNADKYEFNQEKSIIDRPIIIGSSWDNNDIINENANLIQNIRRKNKEKGVK